MLSHQLLVHHAGDLFMRKLCNLYDFVGSAETVENMKEGNTRLQCACLRNQCEVHYFLNRVGKQHGPACRPGRHDIAVIAENRKTMSRYRSGGNVKHRTG